MKGEFKKPGELFSVSVWGQEEGFSSVHQPTRDMACLAPHERELQLPAVPPFSKHFHLSGPHCKLTLTERTAQSYCKGQMR